MIRAQSLYRRSLQEKFGQRLGRRIRLLGQPDHAVLNSAPKYMYSAYLPTDAVGIGATIGSHTGLGTMALFFWGDERIN